MPTQSSRRREAFARLLNDRSGLVRSWPVPHAISLAYHENAQIDRVLPPVFLNATDGVCFQDLFEQIQHKLAGLVWQN